MFTKVRTRGGFTLVELMIVVAIIGILAAIAIPNFLQFRMKAKTSEARSNLGAIRSTEVAYFAEWDYYVGTTTANPIPDRRGDSNKQPWDSNSRFSILGFAPEGAVYYSYQLDGSYYDDSTYTAEAIGDLDADSEVCVYSISNLSTEVIKSGTGGTF